MTTCLNTTLIRKTLIITLAACSVFVVSLFIVNTTSAQTSTAVSTARIVDTANNQIIDATVAQIFGANVGNTTYFFGGGHSNTPEKTPGQIGPYTVAAGQTATIRLTMDKTNYMVVDRFCTPAHLCSYPADDSLITINIVAGNNIVYGWKVAKFMTATAEFRGTQATPQLVTGTTFGVLNNKGNNTTTTSGRIGPVKVPVGVPGSPSNYYQEGEWADLNASTPAERMIVEEFCTATSSTQCNVQRVGDPDKRIISVQIKADTTVTYGWQVARYMTATAEIVDTKSAYSGLQGIRTCNDKGGCYEFNFLLSPFSTGRIGPTRVPIGEGDGRFYPAGSSIIMRITGVPAGWSIATTTHAKGQGTYCSRSAGSCSFPTAETISIPVNPGTTVVYGWTLFQPGGVATSTPLPTAPIPSPTKPSGVNTSTPRPASPTPTKPPVTVTSTVPSVTISTTCAGESATGLRVSTATTTTDFFEVNKFYTLKATLVGTNTSTVAASVSVGRRSVTFRPWGTDLKAGSKYNFELFDGQTKLGEALGVEIKSCTVACDVKTGIQLVYDRTGSMTNKVSSTSTRTYFDEQQAAALAMIKSMTDLKARGIITGDVRLGVTQFSGKGVTRDYNFIASPASSWLASSQVIVPPTTTYDSLSKYFEKGNADEIKATTSQGGVATCIECALVSTKGVFTSDYKNKYIVLLSDGDPNLTARVGTGVNKTTNEQPAENQTDYNKYVGQLSSTMAYFPRVNRITGTMKVYQDTNYDYVSKRTLQQAISLKNQHNIKIYTVSYNRKQIQTLGGSSYDSQEFMKSLAYDANYALPGNTPSDWDTIFTNITRKICEPTQIKFQMVRPR